MGAAVAHLPAALVATGNGMPSCCAKHGQPATFTKKLQLSSRPPGWSYILILAGVLLYLIVTMILRKTVTAPVWPFCDECAASRKKKLTIGLSVMALTVPAVVLAIAVDSSASGLLVLIALFLFLFGVILSSRAGWVMQSTAEVTRDGAYVAVREAHPQFVQLIPAAEPAFAPQAYGQAK